MEDMRVRASKRCCLGSFLHFSRSPMYVIHTGFDDGFFYGGDIDGDGSLMKWKTTMRQGMSVSACPSRFPVRLVCRVNFALQHLNSHRVFIDSESLLLSHHLHHATKIKKSEALPSTVWRNLSFECTARSWSLKGKRTTICQHRNRKGVDKRNAQHARAAWPMTPLMHATVCVETCMYSDSMTALQNR
jgi:hypothetical protein